MYDVRCVEFYKCSRFLSNWISINIEFQFWARSEYRIWLIFFTMLISNNNKLAVLLLFCFICNIIAFPAGLWSMYHSITGKTP